MPTEAEWEYASRAGTRTQNWNGDGQDGVAKIDNFLDRAFQSKFPDDFPRIDESDGYVYSAPVGSFPPNPWGLYNMHGNVSEWCSDWSGNYRKGPAVNPQGPNAGLYRVTRGGGWDSLAVFGRCATRGRYQPDNRFSSVGFRLVLVPQDD